MTRTEILQLLRDLVRDAAIVQTQPDDASGLSTRYYVDQGQLLKSIETELERLHPPDSAPCFRCGHCVALHCGNEGSCVECDCMSWTLK